jgi:hypothetical protein
MVGARLRARRLINSPALALALAVLLLSAQLAFGQQPSPATSSLASLENQLTAAEAAGGVGFDLARIELQAHTIVSQSPATAERIQARRILRRVRRLSDSLAASPNPIAQVAHTEYSYAAPSTPSLGVPSATISAVPSTAPTAVPSGIARPPAQPQGLQRLAQIASNLAQYGAPQAPYGTDPGCEYMPAGQIYAPPGTTLTPVPMPQMAPVPQVQPMPMMAAACPAPTRHYANLDALGWWVKGDSLPALVTSAPVGTAQDVAGVLGQPSTTVLFGNQNVNTGIRWGGRAIGGVWLDNYQTLAIEGGYYGLTTQTTSYEADSEFTSNPNATILARPYFDTNPAVNAQAAQLVAFPNYAIPIVLPPPTINLDGTIDIQEQSFIQSALGGIRYAIGPYNAPGRVFLLAGYRFWELQESLAIVTTRQTVLAPFPPDAGYIIQSDSFSATNVFNGGELGLGVELKRNRWSLGAESRLAMGNMNQKVTIAGMTAAVYDTYAAGYQGGLLAQPTNIGTFTQNKFALIPSVDVKLGFQAFPRLRLTVGYNFTYVSSVVRPGSQVDLNVNSSQFAGQPLVGPADPAVLMNTTSIWLQGITMGGELTF